QLEGLSLTRKWLAIAKTEFFVQTSRFRRFRNAASILLLVFGFVWALFIAPEIIKAVLGSLGSEVSILFMGSFPSLMRSGMLFLWIMLLVYPISYALQEIRIGQWEIMLSNNVSTREMMFGMFLGKVPSYGLLVLYIAPVLLSPFALFFEVGILGQIIMYAVVFFVAISTLFLSTLITTAIQAKLGESSRGNDIAKALAMVVAVLILVPMYGLMYFSDAMSAFLGLDVFLLFPFTWGADIISWSVIIYNGIGLPITAFNSILRFDALTNFGLLSIFSGFIVILAFQSADRIFTFGAGPRVEKITTVGKENFILKGIRSLFPGSFGILVVNAMKEFVRKMQNVSRLLYSIGLSVLLPIILSYGLASAPEEIPPEVRSIFLIILIIMLSFLVSMLSGVTFGGLGFLESKDQLWIIKSAPNGATKFAKARLVESLFLAIPLAAVPAIGVSLVFGLSVLEILAVIAFTYWTAIGAILLCIGVTSNNPAYENQRSSAFMVNTFASIFLILVGIVTGVILSLIVFPISMNLPLFMLVMSAPLFLIGLAMYMIGVGRMSQADIK
ncbi:MAG: hypothetical protein ACFFCP_00325, partial [Promethearchaeota archaeon]